MNMDKKRKSKSVVEDIAVSSSFEIKREEKPEAVDELSQAIQSAMDTPVDDVAVRVNKAEVSQEDVLTIFRRVCGLFGTNMSGAFVAIAVLFLKGAANRGVPTSMSVEVYGEDGSTVSITKGDLLQIYTAATKNNYLRRLAETLSTEICRFAEKNNLSGDLCTAANNYYVAQDKDPLTQKERAWANSFCQKNALVEQEVPRIAKFLAQNYMDRFKKNNKGKDKGKQSAKAQQKQAENDKTV